MKSNVTPIEKKRLADHIIEQILTLILGGKWKSGDKLPPEHELMKQFGVGRSSVREAVGALKLMGILNVGAGQGTRVSVFNEDSLVNPLRFGVRIGTEKLEELIEARIVIEQEIAGLAAQRANEEDIAEIRYNLDLMKSAGKNKKKLDKFDLSFHLALAKASHNAVLARILSDLRYVMRFWMKMKSTETGNEIDIITKRHEDILGAIEAHDIDNARSALRNHLVSCL